LLIENDGVPSLWSGSGQAIFILPCGILTPYDSIIDSIGTLNFTCSMSTSLCSHHLLNRSSRSIKYRALLSVIVDKYVCSTESEATLIQFLLTIESSITCSSTRENVASVSLIFSFVDLQKFTSYGSIEKISQPLEINSSASFPSGILTTA